jgi:hypothetical protein
VLAANESAREDVWAEPRVACCHRGVGEPIFSGLRSVDSVRRGGDRPAHVIINGENHHTLEALVDVSSMSEGDDNDERDFVSDGVDDAVIANPDSISFPAPKLARRRRTGVFGEQSDYPLYPRPDLRVKLAERSCRCRS